LLLSQGSSMKSLFRLFSRSDAPAVDIALERAAQLIRQGNELEDRGELEGARQLYLQAVESAPDFADAHFNLGNALSMQGRSGEALSSYGRAVELQPGHVQAHLNLGATLLRCQSAAGAEKTYREALRLRPESAHAWTGLGCALEANAKPEEARVAFERALAIDPANEGSSSRLAQLLRERGDAKAALDVLARSLHARPESSLLLRTQADINGGVGEYDDAIAAYRKILALSNGTNLEAYSNLLWALNFRPDVTTDEVLAEHKAFARLIEADVARMNPRAADSAGRRLRVGYVSADFRRHSVSCFIEPLLRRHDRKSFEIHCFYDYGAWDDVTTRIQALPERWHEIAGMADEDVARLIASCEIDILVDLAGHSAHNRMRLFAMKPAPVQFTWLGYLCTTGLAAIDYRLCDAYTDPEGIAEAWQVEQPARLPDSQWCYQPQVQLPAPSPLPRLRNGYWTFGSFNQESKLNDVALDAWCAALAAIPDSRLRVVGVSCDIVEQRIRRCFAKAKISETRLELVGRISIESYFEMYRDVDIALDSFPYNGATTTCDALIMGVPVASVAGNRAIARGGVSLLSTLGLIDWIAPTPSDLAEVLRKRVGDAQNIAALRSTLPGRMLGSALMDAPRFARALEEIFRRSVSLAKPW
jgi:protein O-GlcNAc transferase